MSNSTLVEAPLGKKTEYPTEYDPKQLFPIARTLNRDKLGISKSVPFFGVDIWNAFELSWLDLQGKPTVALAEIIVPSHSPNIIESKSLKLYFNSFNMSKFVSEEEVQFIMQRDLSKAAGSTVEVKLTTVHHALPIQANPPIGTCLDNQYVNCEEYEVNPELLILGTQPVEETVYTNLFKSNCLVSGQPDWATVIIYYQGKKILHNSLLKYLISYRQHLGFHEDCVEQIFVDIHKHCKPDVLSVQARFTRRGGLDINPFRSSEMNAPQPTNDRLIRQ